MPFEIDTAVQIFGRDYERRPNEAEEQTLVSLAIAI